MDAVLAQIKQLVATGSETTRRQTIVTLRELADSLEDSNDTIHRYGYLHLQTAAVKVGFDLGLFKLLVETNSTISTEQIGLKPRAETAFLSRLLSYLASIGAIEEVAKNQFFANNVTKNLAEEATQTGISHCFETIGPQYQAFPSFFRKTNYKTPTNEVGTVFQNAWQTSLHAFAWFADHPENLRYFNDYMAFRREPKLSWLTVYPVEEETRGWDPERPVYVNMGGGIGHQCAQFKDEHPDVPGQVILQDMPHTIAEALPTPGVTNMAHDFFTPQPIKGARFYFCRGVLHNHPDHKVQLMLENIKSAMAPDSILLMDEMVLPETGVNSYAAAMDMTMMSALAGMERTKAQWRKIIGEVGLELVKTYEYNPVSYEAVMEVRLP